MGKGREEWQGQAQRAQAAALPLLVGVSLPPCVPPLSTPHHLPLRSSREPPLGPLAFALRPRWHHWVSGLDEVRPIESAFFLAADFASAAAAASSSSSLLRRRNCALELWSGDWSATPLLRLCAGLNLRGCGDAGAGAPDVDEVVVGGGRCSARRDPAAVQRHALPCRHQLRRYLPCSPPHFPSLNKMPNFLFGKEKDTCRAFSIRQQPQHSFFLAEIS